LADGFFVEVRHGLGISLQVCTQALFPIKAFSVTVRCNGRRGRMDGSGYPRAGARIRRARDEYGPTRANGRRTSNGSGGRASAGFAIVNNPSAGLARSANIPCASINNSGHTSCAREHKRGAARG
jgi:hypothetical protein